MAKEEKTKSANKESTKKEEKKIKEKTMELDHSKMDKTQQLNSGKTITLDNKYINVNKTVIIEDDERQKLDTKLYNESNLETVQPMELTEEFIPEGQLAEKIPLDGLTPDFANQEDYTTIDTKDQSRLLKNLFPDKTQDEQLKINRHFLKDVEPFNLERLIEDVKSLPQELVTSFSSLDKLVTIPQSAITLIIAKTNQEKTLFMLNLLVNMAQLYGDKHFVFYSFEEPKREVEIKAINMLGNKPFKNLTAPATNLERWRNELKKGNAKGLNKKAEEDEDFIGLKRFLDISPRIHIIDSNYTFIDLINSIRAFNMTFSIGAIFIDYFQKIRLERERRSLPSHSQLNSIAAHLKQFTLQNKTPLITGALFKTSKRELPEYDQLSLDLLENLEAIDQEAELVIGLQDYSNSQYIGSNIEEHFMSQFFSQPLINAETMPDFLKTNPTHSVICAKILKDRARNKSAVELLFHEQLLKISDLTKEDIKKLKK